MKDQANRDYSNRVADAIYLYAEQDAQLIISNPAGSRKSRDDIELKLRYYRDVLKKFRKKPSPEEKKSLRFIRHEIGNMKARLKPNLLNRILRSKPGNAIRNFLRGNRKLVKSYNDAIKNVHRELIQEHNFDSLSTAMKKNGFNFQMEGTLKKMIAQDLPQFHVRYYDIHHPKTDFVLHFKKIPETDLYYFEKFDAVSRPTLDAILSNDPSCKRHTFSLSDNMRFTAGEAANLVNGKCVCKKVGNKENWVHLNSNSLSHQMNITTIAFNLEKALEKLPIKQKENSAQYQMLLQTLKAGNSKEATLMINDTPVKYRLEAAPLRKTVDVLDKNDQLIDVIRLLNGQKSDLTAQLVNKIKQQEDEVIDLGQAVKRGVRI